MKAFSITPDLVFARFGSTVTVELYRDDSLVGKVSGLDAVQLGALKRAFANCETVAVRGDSDKVSVDPVDDTGFFDVTVSGEETEVTCDEREVALVVLDELILKTARMGE